MNDFFVKKRPRGRPRSLPKEKNNVVQALDKGLLMLLALSKRGNSTLSDLSLALGMPASSVHRMLATLQKHGFVEFDEASQHWAIGIEAFRVGTSYLVRTNLVEASHKIMRELMEETGETANLAIADGGDVVFISQVESRQPIRAFFRPGTRGHIHASGIGKALLANMARKDVERILQETGLKKFTPKTLTSFNALFKDLQNTKIRGYSFDDEERYSGMRCVAASIYNSFGEAVAGISVSGPSVRFDNQIISEIGPKVVKAAKEVTKMIGGKMPDNLDK